MYKSVLYENNSHTEDIAMIQLKNHNGEISVSENVFATVVGTVINNCFGVVGMAAAGAKDGLVSLLKKDNYHRGVKVSAEKGQLVLELHIIVSYGVNLPAISQSIVNETKYAVEKKTGFKVKRVTVCIDAMKTDGEKK